MRARSLVRFPFTLAAAMPHARTFGLLVLASTMAGAATVLTERLLGWPGLLLGGSLALVALLVFLSAVCVEIDERRRESRLIARIKKQ